MHAIPVMNITSRLCPDQVEKSVITLHRETVCSALYYSAMDICWLDTSFSPQYEIKYTMTDNFLLFLLAESEDVEIYVGNLRFICSY